MIDLDAIKASGQNSAERSAELMRLYVWARRVRLAGELCRQSVAAGDASAKAGVKCWYLACDRVPMPEWVAA